MLPRRTKETMEVLGRLNHLFPKCLVFCFCILQPCLAQQGSDKSSTAQSQDAKQSQNKVAKDYFPDDIMVVGPPAYPESEAQEAFDADVHATMLLWDELRKSHDLLKTCLPAKSMGASLFLTVEIKTDGTVKFIGAAGIKLKAKPKKCLADVLGKIKIDKVKVTNPVYAGLHFSDIADEINENEPGEVMDTAQLAGSLSSVLKKCKVSDTVEFIAGVRQDGIIHVLASADSNAQDLLKKQCMAAGIMKARLKPLDRPFMEKFFSVQFPNAASDDQDTGVMFKAAALHYGEEHKKYFGSRSKDEMKKVFQSNLNEVRKCYEESMKLDGVFTSRVVVGFIIGEDGAVTEAVVEQATAKKPKFHACLITKVKKLQFGPTPKGGLIIVHYPYNFIPIDKPENKKDGKIDLAR